MQKHAIAMIKGEIANRMFIRRAARLLVLPALASILFGIKLLAIGTFGNATPFWDQWDGEASRLYIPFMEGSLEWMRLLAPHNEHRSLSAWLLALGLLSGNGMWNPLLQIVINAGLHVGLVCLLVHALAHAAGESFPTAAFGFCLLLFGLPYAHENTLWGFQSCFYFLLLFGVGAIWLVTTAAPLSLRWWAGVILAACSFLSLASGALVPAALAGVGMVQYLAGTRTSTRHVVAVLLLGAMFLACVMLTPNVAQHASLKANTLPKLLHAWDGVLGWPIRVPLLGLAIRNAPAALFAIWMLRSRPAADDRKWFLFALVMLMVGQTLAIAYGRASGFLSSRYKDLFAIDVLANFACIFVLVRDGRHPRVWIAPMAAAWAGVVLGCLGYSVHKHCGWELQQRLDSAQAQEENVRNYVLTGDKHHLKGKPFWHVPHPVADHLATVLDNPSVRAILPRNINAPLRGSIKESNLETAGLVDGYGPETPSPVGPAWGTYGAAGGATTAAVSIEFPANHAAYYVQIPVAGEWSADGITAEIECGDARVPLRAVQASNESWGVATAVVRGHPFVVHVIDSSPAAWVAVGSPIAAGRWDGWVDQMLARWDLFVIAGSVMAVAWLTLVSLAPSERLLY